MGEIAIGMMFVGAFYILTFTLIMIEKLKNLRNEIWNLERDMDHLKDENKQLRGTIAEAAKFLNLRNDTI